MFNAILYLRANEPHTIHKNVMSSPNPNHSQKTLQQQSQASPTPNQFRAISRNNSNTSTTSSSNRGEFSSTLSTTNSVASSRSQLSKLIDHRQLLASCGGGGGVSSTPIRSFQRATISSVVKTRAFDNNPMLQGLLATSAAPSGQNSVSNSQTPSPLSTPVFSRSRSLRMSGGPRRYQPSPSHNFRTTSRTPDLYSFNNSGDMTGFYSNNESQVKIHELTSERSELKESLEFLECERQVLIDSARELKETLQKERSQWKKETDELKKHLTESIAARCKAESQLTRQDVGVNDIQLQLKRLTEELQSRDKQMDLLRKSLDSAHLEIKELSTLNSEFKRMLREKLKINGLTSADESNSTTTDTDCISIVTEMAKLRIELNEKDKIIASFTASNGTSGDPITKNESFSKTPSQEMELLNKFLDQTVECIKGWPEELAGSSHVQNLMKSLLSAHRPPDQDELTSRMQNIHF